MKREQAGHLSPDVPHVEPHHFASVTIKVGRVEGEIEVECHGPITPAFPPSREQPGERGGFQLEAVKYEGTYITHLFSEAQLEELEQDK